MKKFDVEVPIIGTLYLQIEAENQEAAIKKAWDEEWSYGGVDNFYLCEKTEANAEPVFTIAVEA